jgi:single-strand DNA-binding protein
MAGFQQTIIIGNVGRDPEMRYTQSGVAVCSFSVAVTERWNDRQTNEKREKTNWYRVSCWRGLAETANQYVRKGMQIMISGTVEASSYLGQDGQPRATLELTARDMQFLGSRGDNFSVPGDDDYSGGGGRQQDDDFSPPPRDVSDIPF